MVRDERHELDTFEWRARKGEHVTLTKLTITKYSDDTMVLELHNDVRLLMQAHIPFSIEKFIDDTD